MQAPRIALLALCSLIIVGCSNDDEGPVNSTPAPGTLTGSVVDVMGRPVAGVNVSTTPTTTGAVTGADGSFTIPGVAPGSYTVRFAHQGFDSASSSVAVASSAAANAAVTLKERGLIAAWAFDGSAIDVSGHGHDGVSTGPSPAVDRFGVAGRAFAFDGNDRITVAHSDSLTFAVSDFTIAAWIRLDGEQADYTGILSKCTPSAPEYGYQLLVHSPAYFGMQIGSRVAAGRTYFDMAVTDPLRIGAWHFVTMTVTRNDKRVRLYLDGVLKANEVQDKLGVSIAETEPLYFGHERQGVLWFEGSIDDVRMFNRALSATEVSELATR